MLKAVCVLLGCVQGLEDVTGAARLTCGRRHSAPDGGRRPWPRQAAGWPQGPTPSETQSPDALTTSPRHTHTHTPLHLQRPAHDKTQHAAHDFGSCAAIKKSPLCPAAFPPLHTQTHPAFLGLCFLFFYFFLFHCVQQLFALVVSAAAAAVVGRN